MSLGDKMKKEGLRYGMKAVGKLMEDPERATKLMKAVEQVQKGKEVVDDTTHPMVQIEVLLAKIVDEGSLMGA